MDRFKVVIDPGHGGSDPGAIGPTGLREADVTLAVARRVAEIIAPHYAVRLTRTDDRGLGATPALDLHARAEIANRLDADAYVSIHCNAATTPAAHGVETYSLTTGGTGERLAKAIQAEMLAATGLTDRGVKTANFAVLRLTKMPAALVEMAFISNPAEEALLRDASFREKCAQAIARGIKKVVPPAVPSGSPQEPHQTADYRLTVTVNGKLVPGQIRAFEGRVQIFVGRMWVYVRDLAQALGAELTWDETTRTANLKI
ncbi:MAG: N-acetylmuramoyl-L-alanine amidase [Bacillota bacterium]